MAKSKEEQAAYLRDWRAKNPDKVAAARQRELAARKTAAGRAQSAEAQRTWCAENPDKRHAIQQRADIKRGGDPQYRQRKVTIAIAHKLGVAPETVAELRQRGTCCPICNEPYPVKCVRGDLRARVIDHDHATGDVRGVICGACNIMLGAARDNPEILDRGKRYLNGEIGRITCTRTQTSDRRSA
jgi:hypothetical protein